MVNAPFSWDSFQSNAPKRTVEKPRELQKSQAEIQSEKIAKGENSWSNWLSPSTYNPNQDDESGIESLTRNILSTNARFLEGAAGKAGNLQKFISDVPLSLGLFGKAIHSLVGDETWKKLIQGSGSEVSRGYSLPTSEDFRKGTEALTGEFTKPKTQKEKTLQDVASDVGSMGRSPAARSTGNVLFNQVGIPSASNTVKHTIKELGFGDESSDIGKTAAWLVMSLAGNLNAPAFASQRMQQGRMGIPMHIQADVPRYINRVDNVGRGFLQGDPRTALAQQQIAGIRDDVARGQIAVRDLMTRYDALNAASRDRGLFALNTTDRNFARRSINEVRNAVREEIQAAGAPFPQALENWNIGREAWATIHRSKQLTNFVENTLHGPYAKLLGTPIAALLGASGYGAYKAPFIGAGAGLAVPAAYKTSQVLYRTFTNSDLARYYWQAVHEAAVQNKDAFIKNMNAYNKKYEKLYPESLSGKVNNKSNLKKSSNN